MPWWSVVQNCRRRSGATRRVRQMPPVNWFDPITFVRTGFFILKASMQLDYREIEALGGDQQVFAYKETAGGEDDGFWFDFMADTGDGFNATYSVFGSLGLPAITVGAPLGSTAQPRTLPRGRLLILGGDEVYPYGTNEIYQQRLVGPMEAALPRASAWGRLQARFNKARLQRTISRSMGSAHLAEGLNSSGGRRHRMPNENGCPDLFAVAGNHDWFDGLVSWTKLFCEGRMIGGWNTLQTRSYFAVSLPHRWWLIGIDIRLNQDIDRGQLQYFKQVHDEHMRDGDHIVLMTPEPDWIWGALHESEELNANLDLLDNLFLTQK